MPGRSCSRASLSFWMPRLLRGHVLLEPAQGAFEHIALVIARDEVMAFVGVDDQLRWNMLIAQRVPELEGLGHGTFAVAVADHDERWRFDFADEVDGRAFGVDGRIIINRRAEE